MRIRGASCLVIRSFTTHQTFPACPSLPVKNSKAVAVITLDDLIKAQTVCKAANIKPKNLEKCILDVASTGDESFANSAVDVQEPLDNMIFSDLPILPLPLPVIDPVPVPQPPVIDPVPATK